MSNEIKHVDLLVIGAGAGGMTAALTAKLEGLNVLLCEKTSSVGGITATSGGTTWVPGTHLSHEAGVPDSIDDAREFLKQVCINREGKELREAFLVSGPKMIKELTDKTDVKFIAAKAHPDYIGNIKGEAFGGRALAPVEFDASVLGENFKHVRPPRHEFMGLGGMMVNRNELDSLLNPFSSFSNFKTTLKVVLPYFKDRLKYSRGTRLVMGNALVGRLYASLLKQSVPIWFNTEVKSLIFEMGKVIGATIFVDGKQIDVLASKGVVLATGGIGNNEKIRKQIFPTQVKDSFAPVTHQADGIELAVSIGAAIANEESPALWFPTSKVVVKNKEYLWPHIILDRAKPGLLAIDQNGQRFVNESNSYHDFCTAQLKVHQNNASVTSYLICDHEFVNKYGLGLILPGGKKLNFYLKNHYVIRANTIAELATKLKIDEQNLKNTIERYNELSKDGNDVDFGRGTSAMNRFNGDPTVTPNPCMRMMNLQGPFYALAVNPADLASSAGLDCNEYGNVLTKDKKIISGLYACGNDLASIFKGTYPGPGTTIGPAMVFGWRIAKQAAGNTL